MENNLLVLKIILDNYLFHLKYMQILNVLKKKLKYQTVILLIKIVHILKNIRVTYLVDLVTKLFVLTIDLVKIL